MQSVGCCCIPCVGPPGLGLYQAGISYNIFQQWGQAAKKQTGSVALALYKAKDDIATEKSDVM